MKIVITDFFADWCGPCKSQDPILEDLKKEFGNKVEFKKVDIDTNYEPSIKYQIHAVPTLIIEKDDVVVKKYVGVTPFKILKEDIDMILRQ